MQSVELNIRRIGTKATRRCVTWRNLGLQSGDGDPRAREGNRLVSKDHADLSGPAREAPRAVITVVRKCAAWSRPCATQTFCASSSAAPAAGVGPKCPA